MDYNKLVSVVMPVHNGERFLREAIESVLTQTYTNFEFLIIENCSTDKSEEIIKSYKDPRIKLIFENNCGISQGYNRGLKEAKGEFILIHDQDDFSFEDRLKSQLAFVHKNDFDICGSSFNIIQENGTYIKKYFPPATKTEIINKIFYNPFALFNPTIIIKREVVKTLHYFDKSLSFGADYDLILKGLNKYNCGNNPEVLLNYRLHKTNTSFTNLRKREQIDKEIVLKHFPSYKNLFVDSNYILARIYFYYQNYFTSLKFMFLSIWYNGANLKKLIFILLNTVLLLPIYLLRKRGFYYNIYLNKIYNWLSQNNRCNKNTNLI